MMFERTNKDDPRFHALVMMLDHDLSGRYENQNAEYAPFNTLESITAVILALEENEAVGCSSFKPFDDHSVEMKRVFVKHTYRGRGIAKKMMAELETWAAETGCTRAVLETGVNQPEAICLYEGIGYRRMENYEPYVGMKASICYEKPLSSITNP